MKITRSLLLGFAVLTTASLSAQAASSVSYISKPSQIHGALPASIPGFALGLVTAGPVVTGFLPCFGSATASCPSPVGTLEIPDPEVLVMPGGSYQISFTMQTFASTTVFVDVVIEQNGAIVATLVEGELSGLNSDSLYVVYGTDPSTLPTTLTPGTAKLVAGATDGTTKSVVTANLLVE